MLYRGRRKQLHGSVDIVNKSDRSCVLFFVRYPRKGRVKKRLSRDLDETLTVALYKNFILDLLATLEKLCVEFEICFFPPSARKKFMGWLGVQHSYVPQQGEDLGRRMENAFIQAFKRNFRRVIIIGSDIPDLPGEFIREALSYLATQDAVIGPSYDGGYYLIGFKADTFLPEVFRGIKWGGDGVFQATLDILENAGMEIHVLPKWNDVDTFADLKALVRRNRDTDFRFSRTISCLSKHMDIVQMRNYCDYTV